MGDLAQLERRCQRCHGCALWQGGQVFGQGSSQGQVMVVAPFPTGEAKQILSPEENRLFWEMLSLVGLGEQQVYLTSVVKCKVPKNRSAMHIEQITCLPWLRGQYQCVKPKAIVCLGQETAHCIMGETVDLSTHHGQWFERQGTEMMAMEHPGILLQKGERRPQAFGDIQSLGKKMKQLKIL